MKPHELTFVLDDCIADMIDNEQIQSAHEYQPQPEPEMLTAEPIKTVQQYQQLAVLHRQLVIRLKFHHAETIKQLPLDVALQAMEEVWYSCVKGSTAPNEAAKR